MKQRFPDRGLVGTGPAVESGHPRGDWPGHSTRGPRPSSTRPAGNIICGEKFNFKLRVWLVNGARLEIKVHFLAVTAFLFPFSDINPKLRGLGDGSQINYTVRRLKYQHGVGFRMGSMDHAVDGT